MNDPQKPLILSASRTKDMVHRCPDLLADILSGNAPCRWGPHGPFGRVEPEKIHSIVLWTKDLRNLLDHARLRGALRELHQAHGILISLQLTATGLGGSFIEPGIPSWRETWANLKNLLAEGWITPPAITFRFDPFLAVNTPSGRVFSNADLTLFKTVCGSFLDLGIARVTTSRADVVHYPKVSQRVRQLGLNWMTIDERQAQDFCRSMARFCQSRGADFCICCDPVLPGLTDNWGCIDARQLNGIKGEQHPAATELLHNKVGRQRPTCRCTYSRDIGYSTGAATCFSGGFGCLYCYSQGAARFPDAERIAIGIREFESNSPGYWETLGFSARGS